MNEEDAKKIKQVLAQLAARKEILITQEKMKSPQGLSHTERKLDQVSEKHVSQAINKWLKLH